jgi:hypothetical protein
MNNLNISASDYKRSSTLHDASGNVVPFAKKPEVQHKPIHLSPEALKKKQAFEKKEEELELFIKQHCQRLLVVRTDVKEHLKKYRESLYTSLSEIYSIYLDIEKSEHSDDFYASLRGYLYSKEIRIQSNSTDVSLVIRYVFGAVKPKIVNDYGNALLEAQLQEISAVDFYEWIKSSSISNASQLYKQREKIGESREALVNRARILILRMMDVYESKPIASFEMPAWSAERRVHQGSDMVFMVGRGVRRFDRESHLADIRICFFIPPGIDFEHLVINRMAKHIYNAVHHWERELEKVEESVWAGDLYNYLSDKEAEAAEKSHVKWQERMAAAQDIDRGFA